MDKPEETEPPQVLRRQKSEMDKFEERSFLPLTCPIFTRCIKEYTHLQTAARKFSYNPHQLDLEEATSSALQVADEVMRDLITAVFQERTPHKHKLPRPRTGFMKMEEVLRSFDIDDGTFKEMLFRENLLVSKIEDTNTIPVGALSLNIQSARGGPLRYQKEKTKSEYDYHKFLVHLASQFDYQGRNGGSRIMAWVDKDLQTLEETRREFLHFEDGMMEREKLYVNTQKEFYYMRHNKTQDIYYTTNRAKNLICEGANFILMRYLALKRYSGTFEVSTVHINGHLCRNIYTCSGPHSGMVYNRKFDLCKIERLIIEKCGLQHKSISLLTLGGRILKQEWNNCDYILQVNPTVIPLGSKPAPNERVPLERDFGLDLQMFSLYLDAQNTNLKKIDSYLNDYPDIKKYIADYVMTILQLKPENVFEFTAKYFLGFAPQLFPFTEYFDPTSKDDDDDLNFGGYL